MASRARATMDLSFHTSVPLSSVGVEHQVVSASRADLATRLRRIQPTLHRYFSRGDTVGEILRTVSASFDPNRVADALVAFAALHLPVPCWAVVSSDSNGAPRLMAERGLDTSMETSVRALGAWVLRCSQVYSSANLRLDHRTPGTLDVAAVAFPLMCRGRTIASLVGIDHTASVSAPRLSPSTLNALHVLLEPAAIALDNASRVQRAEALSITDELTQLYNSRYLSQILFREAKRAARTGHPLSLLFVDLDGFKSINDRHGHVHGSRVLAETAVLICESLRETDIAARFGGDEFAVVLPGTGSEGAVVVADRIRELVAGFAFLRNEGASCRLTASVGLATLPDTAATVDELLQAADDAMYWAKVHGKNGTQIAGVIGQQLGAIN